MIATAMREAIKAYSMAVAPASSVMKELRNLIMSMTPLELLLPTPAAWLGSGANLR